MVKIQILLLVILISNRCEAQAGDQDLSRVQLAHLWIKVDEAVSNNPDLDITQPLALKYLIEKFASDIDIILFEIDSSQYYSNSILALKSADADKKIKNYKLKLDSMLHNYFPTVCSSSLIEPREQRFRRDFGVTTYLNGVSENFQSEMLIQLQNELFHYEIRCLESFLISNGIYFSNDSGNKKKKFEEIQLKSMKLSKFVADIQLYAEALIMRIERDALSEGDLDPGQVMMKDGSFSELKLRILRFDSYIDSLGIIKNEHVYYLSKNVNVTWEEYNFRNIPAIAIVQILTGIERKVGELESQMINYWEDQIK